MTGNDTNATPLLKVAGLVKHYAVTAGLATALGDHVESIGQRVQARVL